MSAGDGLPRIAAAIRDISTATEKQNDLFQTWISLSDLARSQGDAGPGGNASGLRRNPVSPGLNPFSGDVLDMEGYKAGSYKAANASAAAYDKQVASQMEEFARQIDAASGGRQSYIAAGFRQLAQFVREGRFSGADASRYAMAIFQNFAAGAFQEMSDPNTSATMRALDAEFLRFISGGGLQPVQ